MLVYTKQSKFGGNWYTATNSNGESVVCVFQNNALAKLNDYLKNNGNPRCFNISKIKGNRKSKQVEHNGELFNSCKYYITECEIDIPPVIDLEE